MSRTGEMLTAWGLGLMLCAALATGALAAGHENPDRPLSCLTEEQRDAVHAKIEDMREEGADPEEIHETVRNMLRDYGVENPDRFGRAHRGRAFLSTLTEEQRKAVQDKMSTMRQSGATREEIHTEVAEMLKGYGVDVPDARARFGKRMDGFSRLTEEQRQSVREKIRGMHEAGKSREEIRAQVQEMLEGYGVEIPDRADRGERRGSRMAGLSEEQRNAVREKVRSMRRSGASREEIRAAVGKMLEEYGAGLPAGSGQMLKGNRSTAPRIQAQSHPNPASSTVNITYVLPSRSSVRVEIYNTAGQLVRSYDMGEQEAGRHSVHWDGASDDGNPASSGMYLFRVDAGDQAVTDCLVLIK